MRTSKMASLAAVLAACAFGACEPDRRMELLEDVETSDERAFTSTARGAVITDEADTEVDTRTPPAPEPTAPVATGTPELGAAAEGAAAAPGAADPSGAAAAPAAGDTLGGGALPGQSALDNLGANEPTAQDQRAGGNTTVIVVPGWTGWPANAGGNAQAAPVFGGAIVDPTPATGTQAGTGRSPAGATPSDGVTGNVELPLPGMNEQPGAATGVPGVPPGTAGPANPSTGVPGVPPGTAGPASPGSGVPGVPAEPAGPAGPTTR